MKSSMIKWVAGACVATVVAFSGVVMAAEPVAPASMDHAAAKPAHAKHVVKKHAVKKHVVKKHLVKKNVKAHRVVAKKHHVASMKKVSSAKK